MKKLRAVLLTGVVFLGLVSLTLAQSVPVYPILPKYFPNGTNFIDALGQPGSDLCAKIINAISVLPNQGGTVTLQGATGSQTCTTASNIVLQTTGGGPVTLLTGNGLTLTLTPGYAIQELAGSFIRGFGNGWTDSPTTIIGNIAGGVIQGGPGGGFDNIFVQNLSSQGYCADFRTNSGGINNVLISNSHFHCAIGVLGNGYYSRIERNLFGPSASGQTYAGIVMLNNGSGAPNSNLIFGNEYQMGSGATAVYWAGGYRLTIAGAEDCENNGLCYFLAGNGAEVEMAYNEGSVTPSATWSASTYYSWGAVIKDSNGYGEICISPGTSASTAPAWPGLNEMAQTTDGTVTWQMFSALYPNPGNMVNGDTIGSGTGVSAVLAGNDIHVVGSGLQEPYVNDESTLPNGTGYYTNKIEIMPNAAWGSQGSSPSWLEAQITRGFLLGSGSVGQYGKPLVSVNGNRMYVSGIGVTDYGTEDDCEYGFVNFGLGYRCAKHVGMLVAADGVNSYGPLTVNQIPAPAAPTLAVVGTVGSTTLNYWVVAHCGGGVTTVSPEATITTAPSTLSSTNYVTVTVPQTFAISMPGVLTSTTDYYSGCTWDILKGSTATSLATANRPAGGVYKDTGGSTSAYTLATANTTGDLSFESANTQHINTAVAGNDIAGTVTGSGTTASITFSRSYTHTPVCVITPTSNAGAFYFSAQSTAGFTITYATSGAQTFNYLCLGNPN